jgi:hypothetical protein
VDGYCLLNMGDSITTDHISPAGNIAKKSPAAQYLMDLGVKPEDFNTYGARRGNDEIMTRGTIQHFRNFRQHPFDQQDCGRSRSFYHTFPHSEAYAYFRCFPTLLKGRPLVDNPGWVGVRKWKQQRLGCQRTLFARSQGSHCPEFRKNTQKQPSWNGLV